jgi:hypothetical protein
MLPLRIAFDMDGTLADLDSSYLEIRRRIREGLEDNGQSPAPESRETEQRRFVSQRDTDSRHRVWREIEETPDFWLGLRPLEDGVLARLYELATEHCWEVFFVTQRPSTAGNTVQTQTHRWLVKHGFPEPNVIPLSGGRGKAASALKLDYLIDDTPQNCVDVLSDSATRAILLVRDGDETVESSARRLGIGTARSVREVLDLLVQATEARTNPTLFEKLRKIIGWK